MSKRAKLIAKINKGQDISFTEAKNILESLGYACVATGSHHTFRKAGCDKITIVYRNPIHKDALKELAKLLKKDPRNDP